MADKPATRYLVRQLGGPDASGNQWNVPVTDLESLVTHHPGANHRAGLEEGVPFQAENSVRRSYAVVGGEFQEVQVRRTDRYGSLAPDQVLLIKDFILDDPAARDSRRVDVPAPAAGIIGRVDAPNGVVDILDPDDRSLIARIRHLGPIAVEVDDAVAYGQSLGTQNNIGLPRGAGKHVHIEMDTHQYRQFDNYVRDLVEGRLPVQAAHRAGVEPRAVVEDGVLRVGGSGERVAMVQRALLVGDYRAVGGMPVEVDGVYRLSMQGAVLAFQVDHGLDPTGDIDPATRRMSLDVVLGKPALPPPVFDEGGRPRPSRGGFPLLEQIRGHIRNLEPEHGMLREVDGELVALALAGRAAAQRLTSADHVVFAAAAEGVAQPSRVHVVQGRLDDPAQRRVAMVVSEAQAVPPRVSVCALQALESHIGIPGLMARGPLVPTEPERVAHGI
ncbi:peptidoglycan-binding domain-containing protein [Luteimonas sp. MJ204]|uniref:peptidoglycan-binding domain-containing protein n=1 Tax=Luteimonas sp. MJ145 TaxID=3129234 RepID=UPI0031BA40AD